MATLRAARLAFKAQDVQTDSWNVRIEREDSTVIRYTTSATDLIMSNRVKSDGSVEALSNPVTYAALSSYTPTAVSNTTGLEGGYIDLEGVLDALNVSGSYAEETEIDVSDVGVRASTEGVGEEAENVIDGNPATVWSPTNNTPSKASPEWIEFDFGIPVSVNRIKITSPSTYTAVSVLRSDDGVRFDEVTLMVDNDTTSITIDLPYMLRTRFIRLNAAQNGGFVSNSDIRWSDVSFFTAKTVTTSTRISRADIENGAFRNAKVKMFLTDYTDPYEDDEKIFAGYLGKIVLRDGRYVVALDSLKSVLRHRSGRTVSPKCSERLGSFYCGVRLNPPEWAPEHYGYATIAEDRSVGTIVKPTVDNGFYHKVTVAGLAGASEPVWGASEGAPTISGGITYIAFRAWRQATALNAVTDSKNLVVAAISGDATDLWGNGEIEFTSGDLAGRKFKIKSSSGTTLTLDQPLFNLPSPGDGIIITQGCRKTLSADCITKFDNVVNFQGFPDLPGKEAATQRSDGRD